MCVINVSLHWYVENCWHNCKFNALQWNALGGIFITSLVRKNSYNYLWITILNLIEKMTKKTFIPQEENLIFVRLLHTKPMTRPCSIARGNCEPKTIKCQIYDTDQFTMIWRKTVLPFLFTFFCVFSFYFLSQEVEGWVSDTKKGHPVFAALWGESIKSWQCCKMQWEMEKQVSSTRCRGQQ